MPNPMIRRVNWSITTSTQCVRRLSDSQRNRSMLYKLFECIRTEMRKGSPEGYNPRTGIHNRLGNLKQENPMNVNHYIGFDVHKKSISYCVKTADGTIVEESTLRATHLALREGHRSGGSRGTVRWKPRCSADGS